MKRRARVPAMCCVAIVDAAGNLAACGRPAAPTPRRNRCVECWAIALGISVDDARRRLYPPPRPVPVSR